MELMNAALCSRCLEPNLVTVIPFWNLYLLGRYHLVQEIIHIHRQAYTFTVLRRERGYIYKYTHVSQIQNLKTEQSEKERKRS